MYLVYVTLKIPRIVLTGKYCINRKKFFSLGSKREYKNFFITRSNLKIF